MNRYELLPLFIIRLGGRPFDHLERLRLDEALALARRLPAADAALDAAAEAALSELRDGASSVSGKAKDKLRNALGLRHAVRADVPASPGIDRYRAAFAERSALAEALQRAVEREAQQGSASLCRSLLSTVQPYAVFATASVNELVDQAIEKGAEGPYDRRARERDRPLLRYLQRVCAKNDTISEFGPTAWGTVDEAVDGLLFRPEPGITRRDVYLEKWVAESVAAAMNEDPELLAELCPRVHPCGLFDGGVFVREDTGARRPLTAEEAALLARVDGATAAHRLGAPSALRALAEDGVILWKVEPVALDPHRMERLHELVEGFRPSATRERWLELLSGLLAAARAFGATTDVPARRAQVKAVTQTLASLNIAAREGRRLYSANNPIGEDCARQAQFVLGKGAAQALVRDAEPWLDLWCDSFAYLATRFGAQLAELYRSAPRTAGRVLLPSFLRHCAAKGMPLNGQSYTRVCQQAFGEVKQVLSEALSPRQDAPEWELTAEECHAVRRKLSFKPFGELIYPSADLMLSADSPEAVARGQFEWVISELHAAVVGFQHSMMWACPDPAAYGELFRRLTERTPFFNFGLPGADATCHTAMRAADVVPDLWSFVSPFKGRADYPTVAPARAEVVLDEDGPDVRLRSVDDGRDLGSFVRQWLVAANGCHPFLFLLRPHMPRLRLGKVVVQRQFWTLGVKELQGAPFEGVSGPLVAAVERLRGQLQLPRFVFGRPSPAALTRGGSADGDKDIKPVFFDLESYQSLDVFHHTLTKYGELELSEMLPQPAQMLWREPEGLYTYELRTFIGPRAAPR